MQLAKPGLDLGIVVTDLDAALGFYRDLLGLPVRAEMDVAGVGHLVLLDLGVSTLKLVAPESEPAFTPARGGVRASAAGLRYCTMTVVGLGEVIDRCQNAGCRIAMRPTQVTPSITVAAVEDPDGNWIELMEVDG